ncbi:MAG: 30S ribosomal protein S8 [bacterium]|jgi:small subunit ribosomal protein S8
MSQTDPIADFLNMLKNGAKSKKAFIEVPLSKLKVKIAEILKDEGFISGFEIITPKVPGSGQHRRLKVILRYLDNERRSPVLAGVTRVSTPGRRVYVPADRIPSVKSGIGVAILTTSNGVVSDRVARKNRWGGEIICNVW